MRKSLYSIVITYLSNTEDINNVIQETILKAYKNIHTLKHNEYFKTWILKILINECKNLYKDKYKQTQAFNNIVNTTEYQTIYQFEDNFINSFDLRNSIKNLTSMEQIILKLYYAYDYTTPEIADILNENVNTIKSKLLRTRHKLEQDRKEGEVNGTK